MNPEDLFAQIRDSLANIEIDIAEKQEELSILDDRVRRDEKALTNIAKLKAEAQESYRIETEKLEANILPFRKENSRIREENTVLIKQKGDLMAVNIKLTKDNENMASYKEKAWKVLDAKDQELKQREKRITEKENLSPGIKSFLPPIN